MKIIWDQPFASIERLEVSPKWFLHVQGHDLEEMYKPGLGKLKCYYNEHRFKREVVAKVVNEYPSLLPIELGNVFEEISQ